jgi:hypothetical protein
VGALQPPVCDRHLSTELEEIDRQPRGNPAGGGVVPGRTIEPVRPFARIQRQRAVVEAVRSPAQALQSLGRLIRN